MGTPSGILAEEALKEVLHAVAAVAILILVIFTGILLRRAAQVLVRVLDDRFGVDIDHGGFDGLGYLGELVFMLARGRNTEFGRVRAVDALGARSKGDNRANQQHQRDRDRGHKKRSKAILLCSLHHVSLR